MEQAFFVLGALFALLGVALGAFAGHALKEKLGTERLDVFKIGAQYQMYHALGLLAVGYAAGRWPGSIVTAAGWLFVAGIVLFSGSLYALAITDAKPLGAITPFGGAAFLAGWACLALGVWRG